MAEIGDSVCHDNTFSMCQCNCIQSHLQLHTVVARPYRGFFPIGPIILVLLCSAYFQVQIFVKSQ